MLEAILESTRHRVAELRARTGELPSTPAGAPARDLRDALAAPGLGVIAEIKRRSPSAGHIAADLDPAGRAAAYQAGGAAAISVLTEPDHFGGMPGDIGAAAREVAIPVLRKDFIVDPLQVAESLAMGADAVLLIAAILDDRLLQTLLGECRDLGLGALVEAHDETETRRAVAVGADLIGVNNRDLATFEVDLGRAERLRSLIPAGIVAVAESGVTAVADARRMRDAGFDAVLVGQAATQAADPRQFIASLAGIA